MQLLSNDTCSSMSLNLLCILWVLQYVYKKTKRSKGTQKQTKRNKETKCHVFTYKRLKITENYKTVRAKRLWSLTRGVHLRDGRFIEFWLGKVGCFVYCVLTGAGFWWVNCNYLYCSFIIHLSSNMLHHSINHIPWSPPRSSEIRLLSIVWYVMPMT